VLYSLESTPPDPAFLKRIDRKILDWIREVRGLPRVISPKTVYGRKAAFALPHLSTAVPTRVLNVTQQLLKVRTQRGSYASWRPQRLWAPRRG